MRISDWSSDVCSSDLTAAAKPAATGTLYETVGKIEQITANSVTLSHEPVPALGWQAMTMTFQLPDPKIPRGLKTGDRVRSGFERPPAGPTIRRITKVTGQWTTRSFTCRY